MKITEGKIDRPLKLVIYGTEGIGKSSLASQAPSPLFIDTEGGTAQLNVRRIEKATGWEQLIADVKEVAATPGLCKTLVLDTADWAEQLCITDTCIRYKKPGSNGCSDRTARKLIEALKKHPDDMYQKLKLPIACLVHSGGKSLHAIVKVNTADSDEYRKRVDFLYDQLEKTAFTPWLIIWV